MTQNSKHHYTIGIAGHIDHGKTTLTKALTGKETDHLKEEQERKISIELGFASFPLSDGQQVGVVDVPGHERFIRQMVAGVAGIDLVLLVVAADEGMMPQTKEHLDILNLLGVKRGLVVLTKIDSTEQELIDLVHEQVREETKGTFLENSDIIPVDSVSEKGIDELKQQIERIVQTIPTRPISGITRIPIDRVFSKKGFGTVITGTLYQGSIQVGDELTILPHEEKAKVRQIQVHGSKEDVAYAGQRVAINLAGVDKHDLKRGDVLVTTEAIQTTHRLDVECHILDDIDFTIKQRSDIRLHIGTSEVLGRIVFFDRNECQPGETCYAQLELSEPIAALFEDRFVLRRPTPMTTIGGGMVIDPYASKHRFGQQTIQTIEAKKEGDLEQRAVHVLQQEGMLSLSDILHKLGISEKEWNEAIQSQSNSTNDHQDQSSALKIITGDSHKLTLIHTNQQWADTWSHIVDELTLYHKRFPLREGIERKHVQATHFPQLTTTQWNAVLQEAEQEQLIRVQNEYISAQGFEAKLRPKDEQVWEQVKHKMNTKLIEIDKWLELVPKEMPEDVALDMQRLLVRQGELIQLEEERYLHRPIFDQLVKQLKRQSPQSFTIQDVKQVVESSRKYLIPFLETLDRLGYTTRQDNERHWK